MGLGITNNILTGFGGGLSAGVTDSGSLSNTVSYKSEHTGACKCPMCDMAGHHARLKSAQELPAASDNNSQSYSLPGANITINQTAPPIQQIDSNQINESLDLFKYVKQHPNNEMQWPQTAEESAIAKTISQRIAKTLPDLKGITPGDVYTMAKGFVPDFENALPAHLFGQSNPQELMLNSGQFSKVNSFDKATEKEFKEDASPEEISGQADIYRYFHKEYGIKLEIVNSSGKKLSEQDIWKLLNSPNQEDVRRRMLGVAIHEKVHESIVKVNPYVSVSGWYEPIKINITKNALEGKEEVEMSTRGQADLQEYLYNNIQDLKTETVNTLQVVGGRMTEFNQKIQAYLNQSPQMALQYCQSAINDLNNLKEALFLDQKEFHKYAYWSSNIITSCLAPIMLIYKFPKHAETLSEEDLSLAKDFVQGYHDSKNTESLIGQNLDIINNMQQQIFIIQKQIQQGQRPQQLQAALAA